MVVVLKENIIGYFNLNHLTNNRKYDIGIDNEKI
jgi:hypothetical protein